MSTWPSETFTLHLYPDKKLQIGFQVRNARLQLDLTQEELAERINKKRTFISRIENDGSNLTLKTLRDIVERGLGGKLNIEIQL